MCCSRLSREVRLLLIAPFHNVVTTTAPLPPAPSSRRPTLVAAARLPDPKGNPPHSCIISATWQCTTGMSTVCNCAGIAHAVLPFFLLHALAGHLPQVLSCAVLTCPGWQVQSYQVEFPALSWRRPPTSHQLAATTSQCLLTISFTFLVAHDTSCWCCSLLLPVKRQLQCHNDCLPSQMHLIPSHLIHIPS